RLEEFNFGTDPIPGFDTFCFFWNFSNFGFFILVSFVSFFALRILFQWILVTVIFILQLIIAIFDIRHRYRFWDIRKDVNEIEYKRSIASDRLAQLEFKLQQKLFSIKSNIEEKIFSDEKIRKISIL
ncbi:hypothetical protein LCGC14_2806200, partial [marine sediment metagenome]